jgi:hypothetical protein
MINVDRYCIVASQNATLESGLDEAEIRRRICSGTRRVRRITDFIKGQPIFVEEDKHGQRWIVTMTPKRARNGPQLMAFVVGLSA